MGGASCRNEGGNSWSWASHSCNMFWEAEAAEALHRVQQIPTGSARMYIQQLEWLWLHLNEREKREGWQPGVTTCMKTPYVCFPCDVWCSDIRRQAGTDDEWLTADNIFCGTFNSPSEPWPHQNLFLVYFNFTMLHLKIWHINPF